jgi:hypothetical protein
MMMIKRGEEGNLESRETRFILLQCRATREYEEVNHNHRQ